MIIPDRTIRYVTGAAEGVGRVSANRFGHHGKEQPNLVLCLNWAATCCLLELMQAGVASAPDPDVGATWKALAKMLVEAMQGAVE